MAKRCFFLELPSEIIQKILNNCSYDIISTGRLVCKAFDQSGQQLLNKGFSKVDKYHIKIQKLVKGKLPRRESERRNHPLAKHVNALSAIETRLSLLNMTYMKYIDMGICCFIPGKVLDEMFIVLRALEDIATQPRTHELLQELRDISSMAMEHFDEKIVPMLKKNMPSVSMSLSTSLPVPVTPLTPASGYLAEMHGLSWSSTSTIPHVRQPVVRQEMSQLRNSLRAANSTVQSLRKDLSGCKTCNIDINKKLTEMQKKILDQNKVITEQNTRIADQDKRLQDFSQSIVEYDHKFNELFSEISRLRTELGMEASAKIAAPIEEDSDKSGSSNRCDMQKCDNIKTVAENRSLTLKRKHGDDPIAKKRNCIRTIHTRSSDQ